MLSNWNRWLCITMLVVAAPWAKGAAENYQAHCKKHECMLVIDAGSTGSRAYLYRYDKDSSDTAINIDLITSNKVEGGISQLQPEPDTTSAYLDNLLKPYTNLDGLPVYLYATAGMRLLSDHQQQLRYQQINKWFTNKPQFKLEKNQTITGKQEATFDWLAANYELDTFQRDKPGVGVMDMGGASVQVAFPVTGPQHHPDIESLQVYGKQYHVYVRSFLGLGQSRVQDQVLNYSSCFSNGYPLPNGHVGTGDAKLCSEHITRLINGVHAVSAEVSHLLKANAPSAWYSMGGVNYLANGELLKLGNSYSVNSLLQEGEQKACASNWSALEKSYPDDSYLYKSCLNSAYYAALIHRGYGISDDREISIIDSSWTLGVVLLNR